MGPAFRVGPRRAKVGIMAFFSSSSVLGGWKHHSAVTVLLFFCMVVSCECLRNRKIGYRAVGCCLLGVVDHAVAALLAATTLLLFAYFVNFLSGIQYLHVRTTRLVCTPTCRKKSRTHVVGNLRPSVLGWCVVVVPSSRAWQQ